MYWSKRVLRSFVLSILPHSMLVWGGGKVWPHVLVSRGMGPD